ncbi:MAG: multiple sugar transport system permease protein, partial [Psychromonas sp.]
MFPKPIKKSGRFANISYRVALPISIVLWLLPLIAVMMTSIRSIEDINKGNYWGWPESFNFIENYTEVFVSTSMGQYLLNSLLITLPAVAGAVALSTLAGFALAKYNF